MNFKHATAFACSIVLAAAAAPAFAVAAPATCAATLTAADQAQATKLADDIMAAVRAASAKNASADAAALQPPMDSAVEQILENSGATPSVGLAALTAARKTLTASGEACDAKAGGQPQRCDVVRMSLERAIQAAQAAGGCPGAVGGTGAAAFGTPPNSGGGGQSGGVTHPPVSTPG